MDLQSLHLLLPGAFILGCVEWWLATKRWLAVDNGKKSIVALTVFLEVSLALGLSLIAIKEFSTLHAFILFELYALGGALGSVIPMIRRGVSNE